MVEEKYKTDLTKTKYVNDSKITDHYAIIPTGQGYENFDKLLELHKQVYKVITKRFLAIFYPSAEYNKVSVKINIENEEFNASGKVCIKQGYLHVLKDRKSKDEKPGVSATKPPLTSISSVCLVVCLPLLSAKEISPVFKFKPGFILLIKVDLPAPL